jgi:hypothetical protein
MRRRLLVAVVAFAPMALGRVGLADRDHGREHREGHGHEEHEEHEEHERHEGRRFVVPFFGVPYSASPYYRGPYYRGPYDQVPYGEGPYDQRFVAPPVYGAPYPGQTYDPYNYPAPGPYDRRGAYRISPYFGPPPNY